LFDTVNIGGTGQGLLEGVNMRSSG